jgi:hypothetical protein
MGGQAQTRPHDNHAAVRLSPRIAIATAGAAFALANGVVHVVPLRAQGPQRDTLRETGTSVTGAFEGWFQYPDGSHGLLVGYYNRNTKQELDIPVGPNNHMDPGGPDRGQPTHFLTGRQTGLFVLKVPRDFGKSKITWTLTANGLTTTIPLSLHPDYEVSPFESTASAIGTPGVGDTPPILRLVEQGPSAQGPVPLSIEKTAAVSSPLTLTVWVADDGKIFTNSGAVPTAMRNRPPVSLRWSKYRGPGRVTFAKDRPEVEKAAECHEKGMVFCGTSTTTASFNEPGDYQLHLLVNDYSGEGGGGFQCCWTSAIVKVAVK